MENVLRHYDIVNKVCPAPYVHNNKYRTSWTWSEFKRRISDASGSEDTKQNAGSSKTDGASNTSQKMRYVVQCGAFAEKKNAEAMAQQQLWPYFRQICRRDKDRVALPKMRCGDGILCDRRYCDGTGTEAVGKAEEENGRKVNMIPLGFQLGHNNFAMKLNL